MLALEYGGLGLLAGAIGAAGAIALTWGVSRHVLDIPWRPAPGLAAIGAVVDDLVGIVGVTSAICGRKLRRVAGGVRHVGAQLRAEMNDHHEIIGDDMQAVVLTLGGRRCGARGSGRADVHDRRDRDGRARWTAACSAA